MRHFAHDGVEIAFLDEGEGEPIVLVHGFASNAQVNWVYPGWVATLTKAGRRVIALDNRGHGASSKLYDPAAYHSAIMAEDVRALLDHLGVGVADVHGIFDGRAHRRVPGAGASGAPAQSRVSAGSAVISSTASAFLRASRKRSRRPRWPMCAIPQGRMFRAFAEQTRSDLSALAACIRGSRQTLSRDRGGVDPHPGAGRGRHQGHGRGLGARARRAAAGAAARSIFPDATTCSRSATRCSSKGCRPSWPASRKKSPEVRASSVRGTSSPGTSNEIGKWVMIAKSPSCAGNDPMEERHVPLAVCFACTFIRRDGRHGGARQARKPTSAGRLPRPANCASAC